MMNSDEVARCEMSIRLSRVRVCELPVFHFIFLHLLWWPCLYSFSCTLELRWSSMRKDVLRFSFLSHARCTSYVSVFELRRGGPLPVHFPRASCCVPWIAAFLRVGLPDSAHFLILSVLTGYVYPIGFYALRRTSRSSYRAFLMQGFYSAGF